MTPVQVRRALRDRGYTYRKVANDYGYKEQYVSKVIRRWAGKSSGFPGAKAYQICVEISLILGKPITPTITRYVSLMLGNVPQTKGYKP